MRGWCVRYIHIGSESKATKAAGKPLDDGPPLTLRDIQLAPVIWAKLSGYSWWPARVREQKKEKKQEEPKITQAVTHWSTTPKDTEQLHAAPNN